MEPTGGLEPPTCCLRTPTIERQSPTNETKSSVRLIPIFQLYYGDWRMDSADVVEAFLLSRRARRLSPQTIRAYEWGLKKVVDCFPDCLPESPAAVSELFYDDMSLSSASAKSLWSRLRTFWLWIEKEGLGSNIMADMPPPISRPKIPRTLSTAEIDDLLNAAGTERDYTVLAVLLDTGMRVGELASMTRENVRPSSIVVSGKTGERIVPISQPVHELVCRQGDERYIWVGLQGRLTVWGLQMIVRKAMRRAGFNPPKIGPHTLRHTFGLQYILNDGDVFSLQKIMGHRDISTTTIYVQMSTALLAEQHSRFSPMARLIQREQGECCNPDRAITSSPQLPPRA